MSVDLVLQQLLHGLLLSDVQGCFTFAVHASHIRALADQIPARKARGKKKTSHTVQETVAFPDDVFQLCVCVCVTRIKNHATCSI